MEEIKTKVCSKCKIEKKVKEFSKYFKSKDGFNYYCKECRKIINTSFITSGKSKLYIKQKTRKDNLKGKCIKCKENRLNTCKYCKYHAIKVIVLAWKLPKEKIKPTIEGLLQKLEFCEYTCHYSGLPIALGFSASIDHRIPQAKGGTHELTNLVWCHRLINSMKQDLSEKEFINRSANILVELNYLSSKGLI